MKKLIALFIAVVFGLGISTVYAVDEGEKMPWENPKDSSPAKGKTKKTDKKKVKKKTDAEKKTVKGKDAKKKKAEKETK